MKIEARIIASRPHSSKSNTEFSEAVMNKITNKKQPRFLLLLRRSPLAMALTAIIAIALISGTAYAATSYLWPQLMPGISAPQKSTSGRTSVIVTNCSDANTPNRYELKKGSLVTNDKINDVVKAKCELDAVSSWANKLYPAPSLGGNVDNKPGSTQIRTFITPGLMAVQIGKIDANSLTVRDSGSLVEYSVSISPETKVIVNGQYAKLSQLSVGDAITLVTEASTTTRNQADCTDTHCNADIVSTTTKTLAIVKLTYSFDTFRSISSLVESEHCIGNPLDDCPSTGSIDIFSSNITMDKGYEFADISGKVEAYSDSSIMIKTTSGRSVVVGTPWNLIERFNATKSPEYDGIVIAIGDTIDVGYDHKLNSTNDSKVDWKSVRNVRLLIEINTKGGPYHKY